MTKAKRQTQKHKDTEFEVRGINFLTLCLCACLLLCLFAIDVHAQNLIFNGDFERKTYDVEDFLDGVDNRGRLRVSGYSAPFVVDINGDGKKDIVCGDENWMIWYYLNSGTNKAPEFGTGKFVKGRFDRNLKPVVVDWDGDKRKDVVFGSREGMVWFLPRKSGTFEFGEPKFIDFGKGRLDIGQFSAPAVVDWDGDGRLDLVLGEGTYSANSVYIYLNKGDSSLRFDKKSRAYLAYGEGKMHLTPSVVDWDKDGDMDLIVGDGNGCVNLYLNEAGKGKVKVLKCAGRLKYKSGEDIDIGSMSTPCAVDWDEDGDWDLICGSSCGLIYLILNEGSMKSPQFSKAVALKGKNVLKGKAVPGWSRDADRKGAYSMSIDNVPHAGAQCLKIACREGYGGSIVVTGNVRRLLKRRQKYRLTFFAKGKDLRGLWEIWYNETRERAVIDGVRTYRVLEGAWKASKDFSVEGSWRKVSGTFKLPEMPKTKDEDTRKKLGETKRCEFKFVLRGKGVLWIDDVSLEEEKK